ncbi:tetratricopeptide repeat protein [Aquisphaera insulae]|uniref:tetratricopeptide repeat protein n=1 Tax=Aquisphaera insulae TaxID=2712864 RepID=UPI0013EDEC06|nr:tetratricopeptide repeat protein [Aquisphaera insulae]
MSGSLAILEFALWACGVRPAYLRNDPFAGFTPRSPHFQIKTEEDVEVVSVVPSKSETLNPQLFARHKSPGTYRIVCLGGSTTYGRPFFDLTSYPGWLRQCLAKADPTFRWEVINAGAISYASYRIKGLMAELAQYEPDLFVIDVGHNEFLERRTYADVLRTPRLIREAAGLISQTRIGAVAERSLEAVGLLNPPQLDRSTGLTEEVRRVPVYAVGPEAYHRDPVFRRQVLDHFESGLRTMVDLARSVKARVILVTPASNLRDFAPFKSENEPGLAPDRLRAFHEAYQRGRDLLRAGKHAEALTALDAARSIDARHADMSFRRGQALLALDRRDEASAAFLEAREEDICPFRSLTETTEIIRRVAKDLGVPILDFEAIAARAAADGIPGDDLFYDHVHFKLPGSRLMALELLDALKGQGLLQSSTKWGPSAIEEVGRSIEGAIDGPRYAHELYALSGLLQGLGQLEQALKRVTEGLTLSGGDLDGYCRAGQLSGELGAVDKATDFYRQALMRKPGAPCAEEGLGALLLDGGHPGEALEHLAAAERTEPNSPSILNRLGVANALLGRHDVAVQKLQRAAQLSPKDPAIHRNLGLAEERRGNTREAIAHYRETLRLKPDDPGAASSLNRLEAHVRETNRLP